MRIPALGVLALLPAICLADRVVTVPAGKKIQMGLARVEAMFELSGPKSSRWYLGAGLTEHLEIELQRDRLDQERTFDTFDVSWNQSAPIVDLAPGISFGVLDVLGKTPDGRRAFGAVTFRVGLEGETVNDVPLEVTIGAQTQRRHAIFVGAVVPFSSKFKLLAEHDGERITFGPEVRPSPVFALRLVIREGRPLGSVSLTKRF